MELHKSDVLQLNNINIPLSNVRICISCSYNTLIISRLQNSTLYYMNYRIAGNFDGGEILMFLTLSSQTVKI